MARKNSVAARRTRHAKRLERAAEQEQRQGRAAERRESRMPTDAQGLAKKRKIERRLEQERKFLAKKGLRLVKEDEAMDAAPDAARESRKRMRVSSS